MPNRLPTYADPLLRDMLLRHVTLSDDQLVSYLPISTVAGVLGLNVDSYCMLATQFGNKYLVVQPEASCIRSGAVYIYDERRVSAVLAQYQSSLEERNWPTSPREFLTNIATTWYDEGCFVMPVIRRLFGS